MIRVAQVPDGYWFGSARTRSLLHVLRKLDLEGPGESFCGKTTSKTWRRLNATEGPVCPECFRIVKAKGNVDL